MPELARQRADGVIDSRRETLRAFHWPPKVAWVFGTRRGNHLGQRSSASAKTGRTYGRKRSDQSTAQITLRGGVRQCAKTGHSRPWVRPATAAIRIAPSSHPTIARPENRTLCNQVSRSRLGSLKNSENSLLISITGNSLDKLAPKHQSSPFNGPFAQLQPSPRPGRGPGACPRSPGAIAADREHGA